MKNKTTKLMQVMKQAKLGDADAQFHLGVMYLEGWGVAKDAVEAVSWWRKAAEQGNAVAQFNLGNMYDNGEGIPKDAVEAVSWWRKAAEQGDARAHLELARMYRNGEGVAKNAAMARMLIWQAQQCRNTTAAQRQAA